MKKYSFIIALAFCAIMITSCGGSKSSKTGKSRAEVNEAKIEFAENILSTIDSLEQKCSESGVNYETIINIMTSALTEEQKLVKPDYLMDPALTSDLLSSRQKVNALAILLTERPIREAYGMPVEEVDKAIARLYLELGHPVVEVDGENLPLAEKINRTYQACRENDELCYFWMFDSAIQYNLLYLISNNSDAFFNNITPEQYQAFNTRIFAVSKAAHELARYDEEIESALAFHEKSWGFSSLEEAEKALSSIEAGKAMIEKRRQDYKEYRDWVLL